MPTKAKRLTSIALIFILIIPLFSAIIPRVEAFEIDKMQYREHRGFSANVDCVFDNVFFNAPRARTSGVGNVGLCWYFIVFPEAMLNGNRLNITTESSGLANGFLRLFDGDYDRSLLSDWPQAPPNQMTPLLKGNGILLVIQAGVWGKTVDSFIVNNESLTGFITLALNIQDPGINQGDVVFYQVSIQDGTTGAIIWEQDWDVAGETFVDEQTGTQQDYGYVELDDDLPCIGIDFEIMNPSALAEDGTPWVFTESKFYFFNATYTNFELTSDTASIRFSPDGTTNVIVSYDFLNDINGLLSVSDPADFATVPSVARNFTGALYNSTTRNLWVSFPIWFTNNSPDAQNVDVFYQCSPAVGFLDSGEDFHIYNQGGLVERPPTTSNASFTVGGEWFEGCAYYYGLMQSNITFRKIQHFRYEFALRAYENSSGTWIPEDQAFQTAQNAPAEKYAGVGDWNLRFKVHAWDNASQVWVTLLVVAMWMADGDEGANDEWVSIRSQFQDKNGAFYNQTWNAFIEEEPAARYRTWLDIWINKVNASSLIGARTNAYYFGMNDAGWILFANWNPMIYNSTEAIAFRNMLHDDDSTAYARELDLMKIEVELEVSADSTQTGSGEEFRYCIEDVNINEVKLKDQNVIHGGVNTPIFNAPRVPDMPIGGILAPLYAAILSIGTIIVDALSGLLGVVWDAISTQFPWFTQFIEDIYSLVNAFTQFLQTITTGLVALLDFIAGLFWLFPVITGAIGDTWALITSWLDPFVANAGDWILLAVIVFGIIPFAANVSEGRIKEVRADIETVWGFISTILDWAFRLAKMVIDIILGIIPG